MTRVRLPIKAPASPGRRGGARGTGAASGSPPIEMTTEPWLLDSREVARLLGIGRTKTFQLMARAELPVIRIGRCVRVPRSALADWLEKNLITDDHSKLPIAVRSLFARRGGE